MEGATSGIKAGLRRISGGFRAAHAQYIASSQDKDGGWTGRRGSSDLYYTSFGLRAADVLDHSEPDLWRRAAERLASEAAVLQAGIVEREGLLTGLGLAAARGFTPLTDDGWRTLRGASLSALAGVREAGGYARSPGRPASIYLTFMAWQCYERLGTAMPDVAEVLDMLRSRQRPDGGFAESAEAAASGVNPTAAAVALMGRFGGLDERTAGAATAFLKASQRSDGGFGAHAEAPLADLLSTFTGLVSLVRLGRLHGIDLAGVGRFAKALADPGGGFRGTETDDGADVEYTFYGLGVVGLISSAAGRRGGVRVACSCCRGTQSRASG